jgi:hypothetical protein
MTVPLEGPAVSDEDAVPLPEYDGATGNVVFASGIVGCEGNGPVEGIGTNSETEAVDKLAIEVTVTRTVVVARVFTN